MSGLFELRSQLLSDGRITNDEVEVIVDYIRRDGQLDLDDMKFLVELLSDAVEVCPAFDALFFPALKNIVLADGRIGQDEQFYLLKMLYSDGHIRDSEKQFLMELRQEATDVPPAFDALCEAALRADPKDWCVGGATR